MGKRKSSQSRVARQPKIARPRQSTRLRQSSNDTTQDVLGTSTPRRAGRPKRARHSSGNPNSGRSATTSINPAPETDGPQYSGNETTGANQSSSQPPSHAQPMQGEVDVAMQSHLPEISQFSETTRHRFNNLESERESNLESCPLNGGPMHFCIYQYLFRSQFNSLTLASEIWAINSICCLSVLWVWLERLRYRISTSHAQKRRAVVINRWGIVAPSRNRWGSPRNMRIQDRPQTQ